jgi:hypothetical protein
MLDINELFEKGIVKRGDKIDLANFPNINVIQVSSQEQLDMLTKESKDQIQSIHLSNNTDVGWNVTYVQIGNREIGWRHFAKNQHPMDRTLDATEFQNLQTLEAHHYLNADLRELKLPEKTDHIFLQCSCIPGLKEPEDIDVFSNTAETSLNAPLDDREYFRVYPQNHDEAERLYDERLRRSPNISLVPTDADGYSVSRGALADLIEAYPDLIVKAVKALERECQTLDDPDEDANWATYALADFAERPSPIEGKTYNDAYPEVALCYYDNTEKHWKCSCDAQHRMCIRNCIQFGVEHPAVVPLLIERLVEHPEWLGDRSSDIDLDLALIGAANPQYTDSVRQVLQRRGSLKVAQGMDEVLSAQTSAQKTRQSGPREKDADPLKLNKLLQNQPDL